MKKLTLAVLVVSAAAALSGCSTKASRMNECLAEGVSHDACYMAESQRQAAILGASQKQAYENSNQVVKEWSDKREAKKHHNADQHAQAAHKSKALRYKGKGMIFRVSKDGFAYLDDMHAYVEEDNKDATVYQQGIYKVVVYKRTGKAALLNADNQLIEWMKKA